MGLGYGEFNTEHAGICAGGIIWCKWIFSSNENHKSTTPVTLHLQGLQREARKGGTLNANYGEMKGECPWKLYLEQQETMASY